MSSKDNFRWVDEIGHKLIKSISFEIGGIEVATTDPEHIGNTKETCPFCNEMNDESNILSNILYGNKHVFNNKTQTWTAFENDITLVTRMARPES